MARSVNVNISGWQLTGVNVNVPQRSVQVDIQWLDNAGVSHTDSRTVLFPNFLAQVPAAWVQEELTDLMVRAARRLAGVDD